MQIEITTDRTPNDIKTAIVSAMKYHLNIIDGNVEIPKDIDKEYTDINEAYEVLCEFVHSFDGKEDVCGRVIDNDGKDIDYSNSIL